MLGAFRDVDAGLASECGHVDLTPQGCHTHVHRHLAMQVVPIAFEDIVLAQADFNEQVARGATVLAGLAVAGAADAHAVVDTSGDLDFQRFVLFDFSLPVAGGAGLGDQLARAMAMRAGLLHTEKPLAHLH